MAIPARVPAVRHGNVNPVAATSATRLTGKRPRKREQAREIRVLGEALVG
jgi:hypothetical protein